jgi:hypothetical protein
MQIYDNEVLAAPLWGKEAQFRNDVVAQVGLDAKEGFC